MNYREPAPVAHNEIRLETQRSQLLTNLLTIAFVGLGLWALIAWYGATVHCERDSEKARCTFSEPATLSSSEWIARGGDVTINDEDQLTVPGNHTGPRSHAAVEDLVRSYERFVADPSQRTFDRHVYGPWLMVLALMVPLAFVPLLRRMSPRGKRVRVDLEADEMIVEALTPGDPVREGVHKLSTIGELDISSVWDTGWYEVLDGEKPLFRGSDDECRRVKMFLVPLIAKAKRT